MSLFHGLCVSGVPEQFGDTSLCISTDRHCKAVIGPISSVFCVPWAHFCDVKLEFYYETCVGQQKKAELMAAIYVSVNYVIQGGKMSG